MWEHKQIIKKIIDNNINKPPTRNNMINGTP